MRSATVETRRARPLRRRRISSSAASICARMAASLEASAAAGGCRRRRLSPGGGSLAMGPELLHWRRKAGDAAGRHAGRRARRRSARRARLRARRGRRAHAQAALDNWDRTAPALAALAARLEAGGAAEPLDARALARRCRAPTNGSTPRPTSITSASCARLRGSRRETLGTPSADVPRRLERAARPHRRHPPPDAGAGPTSRPRSARAGRHARRDARRGRRAARAPAHARQRRHAAEPRPRRSSPRASASSSSKPATAFALRRDPRRARGRVARRPPSSACDRSSTARSWEIPRRGRDAFFVHGSWPT